MPKIKDYGEPWVFESLSHEDMGSPEDEIRNHHGELIMSDYDQGLMSVITARFNALAGYDPAALAGLVEACEKAVSECVTCDGKGSFPTYDVLNDRTNQNPCFDCGDIRTALAKLKGGDDHV